LTAPLTRNGDFETRTIAIYTTLSLETTQLQQLEQDLRDADDVMVTDFVQLAPQPHLNSVLDIYNHHVNLSKQDTPQPYNRAISLSRTKRTGNRRVSSSSF
jgi:hypothetical protein